MMGKLATLTMALALSSSPANAKETGKAIADQDGLGEILVIGDKKRKSRVHLYIRTAIKPSVNDQYARYKKKICPVAMGLPDEHNEVIRKRMRRVANYADIKTDKENCDANMALVVIDGAYDFMADIREKHPSLFGQLSIVGRDRLMRGPGPAYAWNVIRTRGSDGGGQSNTSGQLSDSVGSTGNTGGGGALALHTSYGANVNSYRSSNSRINTSVRQDLQMSVVVVEKSSLKGVELGQLADYALVRLLSDTKDIAPDAVSERSILTLFGDRTEGNEAPLSVTAWDVAFLKSLYKSRANRNAASQRSSMARIFEKELVKIAEEGKN